jgi:NAD dependent epimerase/dehydratase family enzyme
LAKALGKALSRPSFLRPPAFAVRLVLGEFGTMLLKGQRVLPAKLLDKGFVFQYPDIGDALNEVVKGND